jgi:ribose transport system ATP-binding protein
MSERVVLRLADVVKKFSGVVALKGVSFEVVEGEIHALLGENGAGKSTLMAIASGALSPDAGAVEIDCKVLDAASPALAKSLGLSVVYQHTSVLDELTVAENLLFSVRKERRVGSPDARQWVEEHLESVGLHVDIRTRVAELSAAERQLLEIAKALASQPRVLVLDEPTESLTAAETEHLFAKIQQIKARGAAVVYISHRLPEVKRVADRITILRDGVIRGTFSSVGLSVQEVLSLIIGRPVELAFPPKASRKPAGAPLVTTKAVANRLLQGIEFEASPGEIVGLAGVDGNGQREFLRALAGLQAVSGEMNVGSRSVRLGDPIAAQDAGIIYLPGDRHAEGLFLSLSVRENMTALTLSDLSRFGCISGGREAALVDGEIKALAIKTASAETVISTLSGGNQQKVLFARSLARGPAVLLADEPTRGVDVGARMELYRILRKTADQGAAVVVLSSDAIELQGLCDRVLVFSRGNIVRSLVGDDITEENITGAAITADTQRLSNDAGASRRGAVHRFLSGDSFPLVILSALIVVLGVYTTAISPFFLTPRSLNGTLFLVSGLAFVSFGQLIVLLTGGIDLSVGPLTGLVVVILSFFCGADQSAGDLTIGILLAFGAATTVGFINGLLVKRIGLASVIATLSTYIALQGASQLLRSTPGGYYRSEVTGFLTAHVGFLPFAFVAVCIVAVVLEWALRGTHFGMELRAIGSNAVAAYRLRASVDRSVILAYVLSSLFAAIGGLLLAGQIGVGDPGVGVNYTLQSISAVVIGGASIFGGRGSFLGALAGAILIEEITAATGFLNLGSAWQYWLPGLLILLAAGAYSRTRHSPSAATG